VTIIKKKTTISLDLESREFNFLRILVPKMPFIDL